VRRDDVGDAQHAAAADAVGEIALVPRCVLRLRRHPAVGGVVVISHSLLLHMDQGVYFQPVSTTLPQLEQPPPSYARLCWAAFVAASVGLTSQADELPGLNL
jgi:hypothetical protein